MKVVSEGLERALMSNIKKQGATKTMRTGKFYRYAPMTKAIMGKKVGKPLEGLAKRIETDYGDSHASAGWRGKWGKIAGYHHEGWEQTLTRKQRYFFGMKHGIWMKEGKTELHCPPRQLVGNLTVQGSEYYVTDPIAKYILEHVEGVTV